MTKYLKKIIAVLLSSVLLCSAVFADETTFESDTDTPDETTSETESGETTNDEPVTPPEDEEPFIPPTVFKEDDILLRVGIFYAPDIREGYRLRPSGAQLGFDLYSTTMDHKFTYLYSIEDISDIFYAKGGNLYKYKESESKWIYRSTSDTSKATVGGYHILLPEVYENAKKLDEGIEKLSEAYEERIIPACINGELKLLIGSYFSKSDANKALSKMTGLPEDTAVLSPSEENEVVVLDHNTGDMLFYFLDSYEIGLGCYPRKTDGEYNYIKIQSGYYWPGIFEAKRYKDSTGDFLSLIMISEMEEYVESVVPWEISSSWPKETLKAFAICVRTYAYANFGRHESLGFDVCCEANCQKSLGHSNVTKDVRDAVSETRGMMMVCEGRPATAYYSAVTGGSIAAAHEVWNQPAEKYLVGQFTPWEKYETHKYGVWQYEATPSELCSYMRGLGYTQLKDEIKDIKFNRLCENSSYVYSMTVTDIHGNEATMIRTRNVKNSLSAYLKSANFVVSHNGVIEDGLPDKSTGIYVMTADGLQLLPPENKDQVHVMTATGIKTTALPNILAVNTSNGAVSLDVLKEAENFVKDAKKNKDAEKSGANGNFIFIGKGYGHGAGMSQIGIRDLAELGNTYQEILLKYFPNTEIISFEDYIK